MKGNRRGNKKKKQPNETRNSVLFLNPICCFMRYTRYTYMNCSIKTTASVCVRVFHSGFCTSLGVRTHACRHKDRNYKTKPVKWSSIEIIAFGWFSRTHAQHSAVPCGCLSLLHRLPCSTVALSSRFAVLLLCIIIFLLWLIIILHAYFIWFYGNLFSRARMWCVLRLKHIARSN